MCYKNELVQVTMPREKVALLTLYNPPLNIITLDLSAELKETLFTINADKEIRVVILTGSGSKSFSVGADAKEFPQVSDDVIGKKLQKENEVYNDIEFLEKPIIAAMEGIVCGGGVELAMACDIRILSEQGKMALPEINLGVFPGSGGLFRLPKLVGYAKAMELMLLGEFIDAKACLDSGLVNHLASAGKTVSLALELAEKFARKPFEAVKLIKKGLREIGTLPTEQCFYKNLAFSREIFQTEDSREGVEAFFAKRKPNFK
jgi:enoyl-CoA hydratase/carnithine racemase